MTLTVLGMLSTTSLSAFSSATTTAPTHRPNEVRLVREQTSAQSPTRTSAKTNIPDQIPNVAPPRGSLVNLSV